jgi:hypothetical protein
MVGETFSYDKLLLSFIKNETIEWIIHIIIFQLKWKCMIVIMTWYQPRYKKFSEDGYLD